jgi:hypothetical protein
MPTGIEITKADIELIEKELKLRLDDAERIAVLREVKSCDVQAGPGSGKTTILIAKLAILARKWPSRVSGHSKPASEGRMKTSHSEGSIADWTAKAAHGRNERTHSEHSAFDINFGGQWLVQPADCT